MHREEANRGKVTAQDIARRLGVSQSTVSRVLSGAEGYSYTAETRQRIIDEAARMGYRPHAVARSLRERRTRVIGFCSANGNLDARNAFLAEIIGSLQSACCHEGLFLLLHNFAPNTSAQDMYAELTSGRIDALVVHMSPAHPLIQKLRRSQLPVVAIADVVPGVPSVVCDDRDGMRRVVAHLADERSHRRIAFLTPTEPLGSACAREEAFVREMESRGLEPIVLRVHYEHSEPSLEWIRSMADPPTAVCCWNDLTALNLMFACRDAGVRVPGDLAVVGFDGLLDPRITPLCLSTVMAHWPEVSRVALGTLQARMAGTDVPDITTMPIQFRVGETT
jgi:DNA-binding LacI/PurR family transcriptional regulator